MKHVLEFEKPVIELREKIADLKKLTENSEMDLSDEIITLEKRLEKLETDVYDRMAPWDRVQMARHPERPTTLDYIEHLFTDFLELHGDRNFGDDSAIVSGIAKFKNQPVTVVGHQRGKDTKENIRRNFGMPHPEGYRKALRLMKQAEKFQRPIITFIDTKGAYPGKAAEERGQSEAIARNLMEMAGLTVPIICIVIGEGGSGGALGLGIGDRIYMLENSTYSVISPEGASSILWKDAGLAQEAAESMKITSYDLKKINIIDGVVPEVRGGAHRDIQTQAFEIEKVIKQSLDELSILKTEDLLEQRFVKYKNIGDYTYLDL
ncbi:acetyl-CoA carboxylase carboxyl transferase subunit alpha [Halobacillus karajensis]|uniref:Acetyl-coenzyme A carboxylase carboxyl transferase subunit alpha n=1 Tax=Halobacillus karajensis TaxID=195088 RepID=A0A024P8H5_9BACI|nr:acetyl-CoA carboxylase carboxyl transferase subunit alpha [Halobacillus karajensis]CDQ18284.1 Acetyl-coenzyme A carboxylase carboxyl transferase subunit alpha [Halobacillus karajensis]CDQ24637.1 Acetyl-coenzyme A carboxylase carboxyl transferase subunit alpha [Halobacillus karajensis]CDQ29116.1 Acetyl-coenzyme A carboxylase carboxyl transferase subunit alpha [Halobacillus karajensis]